MSQPTAASGSPGLKRDLNLLDSLLINIGTILGSAIFIVPAVVLRSVETPFLATLVWILAGFLSWAGAVSFAELAVLFPRAGGEYVYLEKSYGRFWGFLYGWTVFAVIQTAAIAAVAVAFMTYLAYFVPISAAGIRAGAIVLILGLSAWNSIGLRTSANTQNTTTLLKILMVLAIAAACLGYGGAGAGSFRRVLPEDLSSQSVPGFGVAMIAALWAYDGWISITYVGGEVKEPGRFLPRALSYSVISLVGIYTLTSLAYVYALPYGDMVASGQVAADAVERVLGATGGRLAALAVVISCFAAVNGFIFTGARVYYAMAADGAFFPWAARLSLRSGVPVNALLAQGVWAGVLTLTGTYDQLFTYVVFDSWLFYGLGAAAVIVVRRKDPDRPRPYRTPGYPYLPALFAFLAAMLLLQTLFSNPRDSLFGVGILLAGIPAYFFWTRSSRRRLPPQGSAW